MKDEAELKERDSWGQFYATGKIEDYLRYASSRAFENGLRGTAEQIGDSPNAGFYTSDRNHTETDSYR